MSKLQKFVGKFEPKPQISFYGNKSNLSKLCSVTSDALDFEWAFLTLCIEIRRRKTKEYLDWCGDYICALNNARAKFPEKVQFWTIFPFWKWKIWENYLLF